MDLLGISRARTLGSHQGQPHCTEVRTEGDSSCVPVLADCSALLDSLFNEHLIMNLFMQPQNMGLLRP